MRNNTGRKILLSTTGGCFVVAAAVYTDASGVDNRIGKSLVFNVNAHRF